MEADLDGVRNSGGGLRNEEREHLGKREKEMDRKNEGQQNRGLGWGETAKL